jgi:hypothetical protein
MTRSQSHHSTTSADATSQAPPQLELTAEISTDPTYALDESLDQTLAEMAGRQEPPKASQGKEPEESAEKPEDKPNEQAGDKPGEGRLGW